MSLLITVTITTNMIITNVDVLLKLKLMFSVSVASTARLQLFLCFFFKFLTQFEGLTTEGVLSQSIGAYKWLLLPNPFRTCTLRAKTTCGTIFCIFFTYLTFIYLF